MVLGHKRKIRVAASQDAKPGRRLALFGDGGMCRAYGRELRDEVHFHKLLFDRIRRNVLFVPRGSIASEPVAVKDLAQATMDKCFQLCSLLDDRGWIMLGI